MLLKSKLKLKDVSRIVFLYLTPYQLPNSGINEMGMIKYSMVEGYVSMREANFIFGMMPNVILVKLCLLIENDIDCLEINVDKLIHCSLKYDRNKMCYISGRDNVVEKLFCKIEHVASMCIEYGCPAELKKLVEFRNLKMLTLVHNVGHTLKYLIECTNLKTLKIMDNAGSFNGRVLGMCEKLRRLEIDGIFDLKIEELYCQNLRYFKYRGVYGDNMYHCRRAVNISLDKCVNLRCVKFVDCKFERIENLPKQVQRLCIIRCKQLAKLVWFGNVRNVHVVDCPGMVAWGGA